MVRLASVVKLLIALPIYKRLAAELAQQDELQPSVGAQKAARLMSLNFLAYGTLPDISDTGHDGPDRLRQILAAIEEREHAAATRPGTRLKVEVLGFSNSNDRPPCRADSAVVWPLTETELPQELSVRFSLL